MLVWLGAGWQTAFLLLRRKTAINGPRWRGIGGSQLQWEEELGEKKGEEQTSIGADGAMPWQQQQPSFEASKRLCCWHCSIFFFFFLAGRKEGAIFWCEDTCFPSRSRVEFDIDGRLLAGIWNRGGGSGRVVEKGRDVDLFELQFWSPRPPGFTPARTLEAWGEGVPGGGSGP